MASANAASASISKSFHSNQVIPNGSLVSFIPTKSGYVQLANTSNGSNLAGVALATNQSLLAVNPNQGTVQVATSGSVDVLVSNVNGNIVPGDYIAVSPFNGVGMKATGGNRAIGPSFTSFNSSTPGSFTQTATDSSGKQKTIIVGYVKTDIAIGTTSKNSSSFSIQSIQQFAEGLTGKPISIARVLIGLAITIVAIITIVTLTYASIFGGIISVGRNPLAKFSIFRTMTSVLAMVAVIAIVATLAVYLLFV